MTKQLELPPQQKKTKLEKIAELQSEIKLLKEENRRLSKEKRSSDANTTGSRKGPTTKDDDEYIKMKEAISALRQVSITQEKVIQSMRKKAQRRRKEAQRKDEVILRLKQEIKSIGLIADSKEPGNQLKNKLIESQKNCFDLEGRNDELLTEIDDLKSELSRYEGSHAHRMIPKRIGSSHSTISMVSMDSSSTHQSADVLKLKKQLADKSNELTKLYMKIESMKESMYEMKQQEARDVFSNTSHGNDKFSSDKSFDPFADMSDSSFEQNLSDEDEFY